MREKRGRRETTRVREITRAREMEGIEREIEMQGEIGDRREGVRNRERD